MCTKTSNVNVFEPEASNPCSVHWCVLCRKVLYRAQSLFPGWDKIFFCPIIQTSTGGHLASYSMGTVSSFSWPYSSQGIRLTAHIHLQPRLAIPPLLSHAFMMCTRTSSLLCQYKSSFCIFLHFLCSNKYIFSHLDFPVFDPSKSCMISDFRCILDENCGLLGYYAASSGNFLLMFRDNLSDPSSDGLSQNIGKRAQFT
jgi:hypothetical protein